LTNFRQIVEQKLAAQGHTSVDIRAREIRQQQVTLDDLHLDEIWYETSCSREVFLQYITEDRVIAGFLRLSLPTTAPITPELENAAIIREIHVYGQSLEIGEATPGMAQHLGLGTRLTEHAVTIAREQGYDQLAVISAIGTREYYRKRGFKDTHLYQIRPLFFDS
jgi:elongator complex protein 3